MKRIFFLLPSIVMLTVVLLAGCADTPEREREARDPLREQAQALAAGGDFLAAAQLYLNQAQTAPRERQALLRLRGGEYLAAGQLWEPLSGLLADLDPAALSAPQAMRFRLLRARYFLALPDSQRALEELRLISEPEQLPDQGRDYYRLSAEAYALQGNPWEAVQQLIWLDGLLDDAEQRLDNQYRIWDLLATLPDAALDHLAGSLNPAATRGWAELALAARDAGRDPSRWSAALSEWQRRYPEHAAIEVLLPDLSRLRQTAGIAPQRIAVLLPLSGPVAESAAAIRDGALAGYFLDRDSNAQLTFYDTGGDPARVPALYQQAIDEQADFVIGPLLKEGVEQLARSPRLPIPVLALNTVEHETRAELSLYQFGLPPEDEALQVAERMYSDEHRRVLALAPDTDWGARVLAAFAAHFTDLGGEVLDSARYEPDKADFKEPIQSVFNLDDSRVRHTALVRLLGQQLAYEPRRRRDVDAVLLLGFPQQIRSLYPQLAFHHAGDLPVYSTSHTYSAVSNRRLDRDIDGVLFCDMPWVLDDQGDWLESRRSLQRLWPERSKRYQRLFALGFDAYRLLPWLDTLDLPGFGAYRGATGVVRLGADKRLHRELQWARFDKGVPSRLPPTGSLSREGQDEPAQSYGGPR